jgi:hypothetical protein
VEPRSPARRAKDIRLRRQTPEGRGAGLQEPLIRGQRGDGWNGLQRLALLVGRGCDRGQGNNFHEDSDQKVPTKPSTCKPRAQAKPAVLQRHKDQTKLDDGQTRWPCNACLKHFIVKDDATPEACPEGHRNDDPELTTPEATDEAE